MTYIPESLKGYFATMQALSKINIPKQEVNADMINLTRGKRLRALGIVLYGPEGIGKTTLASQFPSPVFIDLESGSDTLDVVRVDPPDSFNELLTLMDELKHEDFKTVVIDTADKLEQLITAHVLAEHDLKSIEDAGYGKGYTYIAECFTRFLRKCGELINVDINVVIVAHAMMRKFEQPDEMGAYDRWELKLSKKAAPLVKEWADMVLFLNYKTSITEDRQTKSKKAIGGRRVMYTTHHPAWDAKNRFGLPDELDMTFDSISSCFANVPEHKPYYQRVSEGYASAGITEEQVIRWMSVQDPTITAESFKDLPDKYLKFIADNCEKIITKIKNQEDSTNE